MIVNPPICSSAPITAASSSSNTMPATPSGAGTTSPGPKIDAGLPK